MFYLFLTWLAAPFLYLRLLGKTPHSPRRLLVIQTAKIGDMVCTTPVFSAIKSELPGAEVTLLLHPVSRPIVELNPHLDAILTYRPQDYRGLAGKWRLVRLFGSGAFDTVICLSPNLPFLLAAFWAGIPMRATIMPDVPGLTYRLGALFFNHRRQHKHGQMVLDSWFDVLATIGITRRNYRKMVYSPSHAAEKAEKFLAGLPRPLVGIGISSGNKMKELGTRKISELIQLLLQQTNCAILLIGSQEDSSQAQAVLHAVASERVITAAGEFSLAELPALLGNLTLYIGVDSGVTYMADAQEIPLIDISGPADMQDQRPLGKHVAIIQSGLPCAPCSHSFNAPYQCRIESRECITSITPEQIFQAGLKLLAQTANGQTR